VPQEKKPKQTEKGFSKVRKKEKEKKKQSQNQKQNKPKKKKKKKKIIRTTTKSCPSKNK